MFKKKNLLYLFAFISFVSFGQQPTVGTRLNTEAALNGYTLYAPLNGYATYLMNNCGEVVNKWTHTTESRLTVELLEDGHLLRLCAGDGASAAFTVGGSAGRLEKVDWNGNVVWSYDYISSTSSNSGQIISHHDFEVLPNGNILLLGWENYSTEYLQDRGLTSDFNKDYRWLEHIIEIEPSGTNGGNIVWKWDLIDHLIQDYDASKLNYGNIAENPNKYNLNFKDGLFHVPDMTHANSIDYNPELDQILITLSAISEVWIIDHSTTTAQAATGSGGVRGKGGDLLYRWGNPKAYNRGVDSDRTIFKAHQAEWVPKGFRDEGKILLYNNGRSAYSEKSKVTMFTPAVDANGNYTIPSGTNAFSPSTPFWEYEMVFDMLGPNWVSEILSGVYRLENGNTLICNGDGFGYFVELDSNDNIVWEYLSPAGSLTDYGSFLTQGATWSSGFDYLTSVYRAVRYNVNYQGLAGQDLTAGSPIELNPYPNSCTLYPDSTVFPVSLIEEDFELFYTNPVTDLLSINITNSGSLFVKAYDLSGREIYTNFLKEHNGQIEINTSDWNPGIYLFEINMEKTKQTTNFKVVKL
jgi:hypothetical protein